MKAVATPKPRQKESDMRFVLPGVFLLTLCMASVVSAAEPEVESIDYAHPDVYRNFPDSLGNRQAILAQATTLKGETDLDTIRNVVDWMAANLKYDGNIAYQWRNYDDVMQNKVYGGCADYGIVCGVLLKAAGIPTVWVKTMDVAWIWDFKKGRRSRPGRGTCSWKSLSTGNGRSWTPAERLSIRTTRPR